MNTMEELLMVTETAMLRGCMRTATMSAPAPSFEKMKKDKSTYNNKPAAVF